MKTNEIQFGGKSYVCRIVEANDGEELLIAPTTLLDALQPGSFISENSQGVPSWMHIGYKNSEGKQRKQLLSMIGGKYYPMT